MNEMTGTIFIWTGLFFNFIGALCLVRFPDFFSRISTSIKTVTFGTCLVLFGTFIIYPGSQEGLKALLAILFLVLSAPVTASALARGAYIYGVRLPRGAVIDTYKDIIAKRKVKK